MEIHYNIASPDHFSYAESICEQYEESARVRGTGIAKREPSYIKTKMENGNAVIALTSTGDLVGFCYIEIFSEKKYVSNSGLLVLPDYRNLGVASKIKKMVFQLARDKYPEARIFGITTSLAVMKINYQLGYQPVTFSELTQDETFWNGCKSCPNYDILTRNNFKMCLCTGMLAPSQVEYREIRNKKKKKSKK